MKWNIVALYRKYTTWLEMQQVLNNSIEMKVIKEYGWDNLVQYKLSKEHSRLLLLKPP